MIEIRNIKIPVSSDKTQIENKIMKKLRLSSVPSYRILKRSIDARKKPQVFYIYSIGVYLEQEATIVRKLKDKDIVCVKETCYQEPVAGKKKMSSSPIIVGAGPAGLFCGLLLAKHGYKPIIVERGLSVEDRIEEIKKFFETGQLNPECNVQFGEGGAGTFSDGKLNTQVKDKYGRLRFVLETFVEHGAPEEILYDSKPHIGTDLLIDIVKRIRETIISLGGSFWFNSKVTDLKIKEGKIVGITVQKENTELFHACEHLVLAIGHSARDTFDMLFQHSIDILAKDFAMGVRIEHLAKWIQKSMYGDEVADLLPAAPYKLTYQTNEGRGVYTFCMCPGGYVVNASSEFGYTAVNGMSYSKRDGVNSNTALIVTVRKEDFPSDHPLAGVQLQRQLEKNIFEIGNGKVVSQRFEDFCNHVPTKEFGVVKPQIKGQYLAGNVRSCLPDYIGNSIEEAIFAFGEKIQNYSHKDAVISGVESRTSSPIRMERNEQFMSNVLGVYPCGEGAGYAGGIMSAAMDGMKVAEAIITYNCPA